MTQELKWTRLGPTEPDTLELELEQAGKQFDMRLYPGQRHGIRGSTLSVNLYEMMTRFLHRTLLETAPLPAAPAEASWMGR